MERARKAGAVGIIVRLDWSFSFGRDWGSPRIPEKMTFRGDAQAGADRVVAARLVLPGLKAGEIPVLTAPNLPVGGTPAHTFFGGWGQWLQSAPPSLEDVAWLRSQWDRPFMLMGVTRIDDAKRTVDAGVSAISVSNPRPQQHGRNPGHDPDAAGHRPAGLRPGRGAA
jgi:L-lactate dehydrogenase (cytochrome)/glycolate oxidase